MKNNLTSERITNEQLIALMLCFAVFIAWILRQFIFKQTAVSSFSPSWLPPLASVFAAAGVIRPIPGKQRLWNGLLMTGLLMMVWAANGFLFDLLTMAGTIGDPATGLPAKVKWPGAIVRVSAFASAIILARLALSGPAAEKTAPARWYGYAAFVIALPYPVFRIIWAFGGTPGLSHAGAGGEGFAPLILAIPWIMAAILSLLLVSPNSKPRRLLLVAGWTATAIVGSIGPAAFWSLVVNFINGKLTGDGDIAVWVFSLFYISWFLWGIVAFAATRSYQIRSAKLSLSK